MEKLPPTSLCIEGEEYSILKQPPESSSLVSALKDDLYGDLNLKVLVDNLKSVARFIRVTYYATGAAPPVEEVQEIRLDICHLGNNISKLCDQSAITVASFKSTSKTVLNELQAAYEYLMDGLEDMALYSLSTLSEHAEKMADAADRMKKKFQRQAKEVDEIAEKTKKTHNEHEREVEVKKKQQIKLRKENKLAENVQEEHSQQEQKARREKEKYQKMEDTEIENIDTGFCSTLGRMLLGISGMEKAEMWRAEKIKHLNVEIENRKLRRETMAKQVSIMKDMEDCKFEEIEYDKVTEFLHLAVTVLQGLAAVMEKAVIFWKQLQKHCQELADEGIKKQVKYVMCYDSDGERLKIWTSKGFKKQAITYYAKWVALHSMCGEYMGHIRQTQDELYVYITENPTREQCRENLRKLCQDFGKDMDSAQETSEQLNSKAMEEIEYLKQSSEDEDF